MAAAAAGGANEEEADGEQRDCSFATFLKFTELMPLEKELIECARTGNMPRLKELIKKGVDVCCCNDLDRAPLHYAAANGHTDIIKHLLKLMTKNNEPIVQVDARDKFGMTALMFAALFGKTAAMTALAKLKAQQRAVNRDGMNLLHLAAIAGRDESIAHILTNFTRVNALQNDMSSRIPLHYAAMNGNKDSFNELVKAKNVPIKQMIDNKDKFGRTPLYYACERGHVDMAKLLLERGAAHMMYKPKEESGAQEAAGGNGKQGAAAAPPPAIGGHKEDEVAENSVQPVYAAVSEGHHKILELMFNSSLVKKFDNKHLVFADDRSALHVAAEKNHHKIIRLVGRRCALEDNDPNGHTPLQIAIMSANPESAHQLLMLGAEINSSDAIETPLHLAIELNRWGLVFLLLQCDRIDTHRPNPKGKVPLMMAAQSNYTGIVDMLIRHQRLEQLRIDAKLNFPYSPDLVVEELGVTNEGFAEEQEDALGGALMEGERELSLEAFKAEAFGEIRRMRDRAANELALSTSERLRELVASTNRVYKTNLAEAAKNARITEKLKNMLAFVGFGSDKEKEEKEKAEAEARAAEELAQFGRKASMGSAARLSAAAAQSRGTPLPGTNSPAHFAMTEDTGEPSVPIGLMPEEAEATLEDFNVPKNVLPSQPPTDEALEAAKTKEAYTIDPEKIILSDIKDEDVEHMNLISATKEQQLMKEEVTYKLQVREPIDEMIPLVAGSGGENGLSVHVVEVHESDDTQGVNARIVKYLNELKEERIEESKKTFDIFNIDVKVEPEKILSQDRPPRPVRQLGFNVYSTPYDLFHIPPMRTGVCADVDWDAIERFLYIVAFDVLRNDDWIRLAKLWHFSNEQISVIALQDAGSKAYGAHAFRMLRIWLSTIPDRVFGQSRGAGQILRALADSLTPLLPPDRLTHLRIATQEAERALNRGK